MARTLFPRFSLLLCMTLPICCAQEAAQDPQTAVVSEATKPPTSGEMLAKVQAAQEAGRIDRARQLARELLAAYPESEEASGMKDLISALEEEARSAQEAARRRLAEAQTRAEAEGLRAKWSYAVREDAMTSRKTRQAQIQSENSVEFDFPYSGRQRATLILRDHPSYGKDAILRIEKGQILCHSFSTCDIRVRFDEGTAVRWSAGESSDGNSTVIFLRNYSNFVRKLSASRVVRIQVPIYQEGNQVFEFRVGGFDSKQYAGGS